MLPQVASSKGTGINRGLLVASALGPGEVTVFRYFALDAISRPTGGVGTSGRYNFLPQFASRYIDDLVNSWLPRFDGLPRLKVAVETGNGTAGRYVPEFWAPLWFYFVPRKVVPGW